MLIGTVAGALLALGLAATPPEAQKLTIDQAVQRVQQKTGGRVLSADQVRSGQGSKYRIKTLLDDGRVRVIEVDSDPTKGMRNLPDAGHAKEKR